MQIQELHASGPGRKRYYTFTGAGPGVAVKANPFKSGINMLSDWKEFTLPVSATVDDFEGVGSISQLPGVSLFLGSLSAGMFVKFYNPCWYEVYLNTSSIGLTSGFGATVLSYYQGWWERRD